MRSDPRALVKAGQPDPPAPPGALPAGRLTALPRRAG
jgi:hypothetical protein